MVEKKALFMNKEERGRGQVVESRPGFAFDLTLILIPPVAPSSASAPKTQAQPVLDGTEKERERKKKHNICLFVKNGSKHFFSATLLPQPSRGF